MSIPFNIVNTTNTFNGTSTPITAQIIQLDAPLPPTEANGMVSWSCTTGNAFQATTTCGTTKGQISTSQNAMILSAYDATGTAFSFKVSPTGNLPAVTTSNPHRLSDGSTVTYGISYASGTFTISVVSYTPVTPISVPKYFTYTDNWNYWERCPSGKTNPTCYAGIAPEVTGINSFATVNDDGTLDVRYPIFQPQVCNWGCQGMNPSATTALAVGGWGNSNIDPTGIENMGLYNVITNNPGSPISNGTTASQKMLINTLFVVTQPSGTTVSPAALPLDGGGDPALLPLISTGLGYKTLVIDFEGFGAGSYQNPSMVTTFMKLLRNSIPSTIPIHMAIPGYVTAQTYLEISELMLIPNLKFHLMLYDYASGLPVTNGKVAVTSNASLVASYTALQAYVTYGANLSILTQSYIGFPNYGRGFVVTTGQTAAQLTTSILAGKCLATYAVTANDPAFDSGGLISDDDILAKIGTWDGPTNGWVLVTVPVSSQYPYPDYFSANDYYYYNPTNGLLISAFPNGTTASSIGDLAQMVLEYFPDVYGYMNWEAEQEFNQTTKKMTSLIQELAALKASKAAKRMK